MNTKKKAKKNFFFKLMNNEVLGKNIENVRKHRDIIYLNLSQQKKRNCLVSEPNCYTTKSFTENLLEI